MTAAGERARPALRRARGSAPLPRGARLRRLLAAALALLPGLAVAGADAAPGEPAPRVAAIEVVGATRTTRGTVLAIAGIREGDPWPEGAAEAVLRRLRNERLFYDVTVDARREADGVRLRIGLRDKWSLIPIPLVIVRDGRTTYGATLLESNLLGRAKRLFAFGSVEEGRGGGTLLYIDPRLGGGRWQLFAFGTHADRVEDVWEGDREAGSFVRRSTGGVAALGRRLGERTTLSGGVRAFDYAQRDPEGGAQPPPDARERALSVRLEHDALDYDEETVRGTRLLLSAQLGVAALGDGLGRTVLEAELRRAANPVARHTLTLEARAFSTTGPDYPSGRPTEFLRGYEEGRFRPDRLLGASAEYRVPVARFRAAVLALDAFADAALLRDRSLRLAADDLRADAGLAAAVYLRRVAVPVLQLYAAYGFSTGKVLPGFSLGFAF